MPTTKKKTGRSIERALELAVPHYICKPEEWYNRKDIMDKLEEINPLYLVSDQTFFCWIRKYYSGTFKKQGLITFYQGLYLNPVLDNLMAFKELYNPRRQ